MTRLEEIEGLLSNEDTSYEEYRKLEQEEKDIIHKIIENREEITSDIYNCLMDIGDYEEGEIIETGRHGWYLEEVIFHFRDKHYMGIVWRNDMNGDEWEPQVLKEVKLKEVKVLKWVEEED
jgi:hypothetical protein